MSNIDIFVTQDEIREFEKLKVISQKVPIAEKIKQFERKYQMCFDDFEKVVKENQENYENWDDYIEWKGYIATFHTLERKLGEIQDARHVRIAD